MKRMKRLAAASVTAGLLIAGLVGAPAHAATYAVEGTLNCGGALAQYGTFRSHSSGGAALKKTFDNWITGTETRYGLRNGAGTQVTKTLAFAVRSYVSKSFQTTGGSSTIPTGSYAINARIGNVTGSGTCGPGIPHWKGDLTL